MSGLRPVVVFLAFANDRDDRARYLRNLPKEQRRIREAIAPAVEAGLCEVVERNNAGVDDVFDVLQDARYRDRVAIFHYGGHAGPTELMLETPAGGVELAHAGGLAAFLGEQHGLALVFLNGCSSAGQVQGLLDAGVPAVIATAQAIDDAAATELAARFYRSLASGAPLCTAFVEAKAAVCTRWGTTPRAVYRSTTAPEVVDARWPWDLYLMPGAAEQAARWNLALAAHDPLFGLPPPPEMDLPSSPFKHLQWFTRDDAPIFFGRGREIRDLYETLTALDSPSIVLLFGESGVGKSSLLAAGLAPRLEATHEVIYARRDGTVGLVGTLARCLGVEEPAPEPAALAAAWRARERDGRPLVVILDQVEEAWSQGPASVQEAAELASALRAIFASRETRPKGRLLLGFRKEWLAEVLHVLDVHKLPRSRVDLQHLSREGIAEVVRGPASTERLRRHFRLEIEPSLAGEVVADLFSEELGAAIAPALQILLSKMWAVASEQDPDAPRFTVELYRRLKRQGILLDDFVEEQLAGLRQWNRELVDVGLAVDLLAHHTTELGTAETRDVAEVLARYGDRPQVLALLVQCKERYLLTGTARMQDGALVGTTRLAHDTLAPLVRRRFDASVLPGQRGSRILAQRAREWANDEDGQPLDHVDLKMVEQGASGMPVWSADERRLVEASRRERNRRVRGRRALRIAAATAAVAIAASAGIAWRERAIAIRATQKAQDTARVVAAKEWLATDATVSALLLLEVARPDDVVYSIARLREVLGAGFARSILRGHEEALYEAAFSPDGTLVVTASLDGTARVWAVNGAGEPVVLRGHQDAVGTAAFSPDGRRVVTSSDDATARVWAADGTGEAIVLRGHEGRLQSAVWSPDGERVATASMDGTARVWRADGRGEPVVLRGHQDAVGTVAFSADGRRLVTSSDDGTARVWAADGSGEPVVLRGHEGPVWSAAFSADGKRVVTASNDMTARVWSADGYGDPAVLRGHQDLVVSAAFSPDGRFVVTSSSDGTVRVWPADDVGEPTVLRGHGGPVKAAAFSRDGRHLATASMDGTARVWRLDGAGEPVVLRGHDGWVQSVGWSADGAYVVTASDDRTARVWSIAGFSDPLVLPGPPGSLTVATSADGKRVATGSEDTSARVWATDGSGDPVLLGGHEQAVAIVAFNPDGQRIVTASGEVARVWPADPWRAPTVLRGHAELLRSVAFSPDGKRLVTGSLDATARVWAIDGSGQPVVLRGHEGSVESVAFNGDGSRIVTASVDGTARVWAADGTGKAVVLRGHGDRIENAAFSPDGRRVVTASRDTTARVWAADGTGEPVVLRGHSDRVMSAAFSPDGKLVVTASADGTARVWEADGSGEPVVLHGHRDLLRSAAFSPHGRRVVTASDDRTARVWDTASGRELVVLPGHQDSVTSAAFTPDGGHAVTGSVDGTARVWTTDATLLAALVRSATNACLEPEFRISNLGESKQEAMATYERCRQCVGPWQQRFDERAIRQAPHDAWGEWRRCVRG